jgi:hypothetical protein
MLVHGLFALGLCEQRLGKINPALWTDGAGNTSPFILLEKDPAI